MIFVLVCSNLNNLRDFININTDFQDLSLKCVNNARDVRNNVKDHGRRRKRDGSFGERKEKQKILAISSDDVCQSVSEPRIPRMASLLARPTALSVELVYTKSRGAEPLHSERKARATMGSWGPKTREKPSGIARRRGWHAKILGT